VWGYWLIEAKRVLSIAILRLENGSREAFHTHAFNSVSWVLAGRLTEHHLDGRIDEYRPSLRPIITRRDTFHKVVSSGRTWVLTFRGSWTDRWHEHVNGEHITLTSGRVKVAE